MKNQGGKMSPGILFILAFVLFVAAIVVYLQREDTNYSKTSKNVEENNQLVEQLRTASDGLKKAVEDAMKSKDADREKISKLWDKMEMLEMRLNSLPKPSSVVHKDAPMPQPLKVELTTPIKVIYRESKAVPTKKPESPPAVPAGKKK